jgi:hypothetical protein
MMIGFWTRIAFAFRCFFRILWSGRIPDDIAERLVTMPAGEAVDAAIDSPAPEMVLPGPAAEDSFDRAVQMLALLQREGRLVDFLTEDIGRYGDAQVGAAVRDVHQNCRGVLRQYLTLEPVLPGDEGEPVTVHEGFDPGAVKLVGNVAGTPPLRGVLRHRGWRVIRVQLPPLPHAAGRAVVAPAEVEIP